MDPPAAPRHILARSPLPPSSSPDPSSVRPTSKQSYRPSSSGSDTSASSNLNSLSIAKRSPYNAQQPSFASQANRSNTSLASSTRPSAPYLAQDGSVRRPSPLAVPLGHRPRQHSQGFFEPSMPSASLASQSVIQDSHNMTGLTASQIAAQAAMQHVQQHQTDPSHARKRSQTVPQPQEQVQEGRRTSKGGSTPPLNTQTSMQSLASTAESQYKNGLIGNTAATTAAMVAFPRNLGHPALTSPVEEKESKKGLKRFRPKHIGISRDKEPKDKPLPSPNKILGSGLANVMNASTSSLADTLSSNNSSMYMLATPSTTTITPLDRTQSYEKEKPYKPGLRQKLKLKDRDDHLALSSASSNSRPTDIKNPQSLYSFAPASPSAGLTFAKSVSGLDLRHGGRALREKKKEEKAQASAALEHVHSRGDNETSEWPTLGTSLTVSSATGLTPYSDERPALAGFGLNNMTADDAWDFLKAKLLNVFEGEDVRTAVEDLNKLVTVHVKRCVQRGDPSIMIEDFNDMLRTGFLSLNYTLRAVPDERLVPHLVSMWVQVFGSILPFMQAVFLPLDHEFKGRGTILSTTKLATEFWGGLPRTDFGLSSSSADGEATVSAGEELDVRRILLISFRDTVILPRFDVLKATFSRLSLDSINATLAQLELTGRDRGNSGGSDRLGPPQSLDPTYSSYSSQTSTLLGTMSSGARSRATSNLSTTSNPAQEVAFQSFSSPPAARPSDSSSAQVTETVGRMLQCLCVLSSVQSGDEAQEKMEELCRQIKLNWLGRGRTGRNRKGFVGSRVRPMRSVGSTIRRHDRDGSPTPTPTRQGTVIRQVDERSSR